MSERWVIKVGSALVSSRRGGLNTDRMDAWAAQVSELARGGKQVVLVSSGSIPEGINRLGWERRPHDLHRLQAAAAVGQMGLMQAYHRVFAAHGLHTAQVLLTREDLSNRRRYLNARATLMTLLELGVVPVINENDTVSTDEIQLGDNDTLAACVANLTDATLLLILTDQEGLFDQDPRHHPDARLIKKAHLNDALLDRAAGPSAGELGRGGMKTKVEAARRAALSGTSTVIASGLKDRVILRVAEGEASGTLLEAEGEPMALRKRWISNLKPGGTIFLDDGACRALRESGKSLLPVGVVRVEGDFRRGDMVLCRTADGELVAHGLSNYEAEEARRIIGRSSDAVKSMMGARFEAELVHRDNLALVS